MFLDSSPALGTVKYACKVDVSWSVADDSWGKYEAAMKAATRKNVIPGCASVTERWTIPWDLAVSMILWYFMPLLFVVEGIFSKNVWYTEVCISTSHTSHGKHARTKVVLRHGKLIHARAFGFADLETKRPFSLDTLCRTFCLTKTYVPLAWSKWLEMDQTWCSLETIKMWLITELATLPEYYCVFLQALREGDLKGLDNNGGLLAEIMWDPGLKGLQGNSKLPWEVRCWCSQHSVRWAWFWSLEKTQVTVAFMILVEQGRVRLDDPVAKFLPAFADVQADERAGNLQEIGWHVAVQYAKSQSVLHETMPCRQRIVPIASNPQLPKTLRLLYFPASHDCTSLIMHPQVVAARSSDESRPSMLCKPKRVMRMQHLQPGGMLQLEGVSNST